METDCHSAPLGKREMRKRDRRQAIIDAARRSFLDEGYAATSMSGLLTTIGGSKATLWGYFRSKEDLFAAVIEDVTMAYRAEVENELTPAGDLEKTLQTFCRRFIETTTSPEPLATWRLVIAESGRFPEVGRIFYAQAARHIEQALEKFIEHHIDEGALRCGDPKRMAEMLLALCVSQNSRVIWENEEISEREIVDRSTEYSEYFLKCFSA